MPWIVQRTSDVSCSILYRNKRYYLRPPLRGRISVSSTQGSGWSGLFITKTESGLSVNVITRSSSPPAISRAFAKASGFAKWVTAISPNCWAMPGAATPPSTSGTAVLTDCSGLDFPLVIDLLYHISSSVAASGCAAHARDDGNSLITFCRLVAKIVPQRI